MDPLIVLLIVVISVLSILMVIVGIQVILILKEIRNSLNRVNNTLDNVDKITTNLSSPFSQMGGLVDGVKSGLKVAETFISWLKKSPPEDNEE